MLIIVEQARQFCQTRSFQVDMTYKRVFDNIYEIAFAAMNEAFGSGHLSTKILLIVGKSWQVMVPRWPEMDAHPYYWY